MTLRAGLVGLGVMGRNHARVLGVTRRRRVRRRSPTRLRPFPTPSTAARSCATSTSSSPWASTTPSSPRRRSSTSTSGTRLAEAGIHALIEKPVASTADDVPHPARPVRRPGADRRRRSHRALQPRPAGGPAADRGRPARRDLSDRDPASGSVPRPHRRRRGHQGPRVPRHRPDRLGRPAGLRLGQRAHGAPQRSPARGHGGRRRHPQRRHHHIAHRELAHSVQRARDDRHRREGRRSSLTPSPRTSPTSRTGASRSSWDPGEFRGVSEGDSTRFALDRKEPLLRRARGVPRLRARRRASRHRHPRRGRPYRRDRRAARRRRGRASAVGVTMETAGFRRVQREP